LHTFELTISLQTGTVSLYNASFDESKIVPVKKFSAAAGTSVAETKEF